MNLLFNFFCIALCLNSHCGVSQDKKIEINTEQNILFVGNSLTYTNNLPKLLEKKGRANGIKIKADMLAYSNYSLEDHWNDGELQNRINTKHYNYVIVQQGPSSQNDSKTILLNYGKKIEILCTNNKSKLAFFMVWPSFSNLGSYDGVINNYREASKVCNALLCPVGEIWKMYFEKTKDFSFYGPDLFHPSKEGSQNAAKIIYETLFVRN